MLIRNEKATPSRDAWNVPTISLPGTLFKRPKNDFALSERKYTILDGRVSFYSAALLAELCRAIDCQHPVSLVAFRPHRIALHLAVVYAVTRIQFANEEDMQATVKRLHQELMTENGALFEALEKERKGLVEFARSIASQVMQGESIDEPPADENRAVLRHMLEWKGKLNPKAICGEFIEGFVLEEALALLAVDAYCQPHMKEKIALIVEKRLETRVARGEGEWVEGPASPQDRCTFMITGGISSGKGTSALKVKLTAESRGITWKDLVKVNGDAIKPLLLIEELHPLIYSQLCNDEASTIKSAIFSELSRLAQCGKAPHALIDQTEAKIPQIQYALAAGGRLECIIVSTEIHTCVERAFMRGMKTGRYEDTANILKNHRVVTTRLPENIAAAAVGNSALFVLVDNNVAFGQSPETVMVIDACTGSILVQDRHRLENFISKVAINDQAKTPEELILPEKKVTIDEYLLPLTENGYNLTIAPLSIVTPRRPM